MALPFRRFSSSHQSSPATSSLSGWPFALFALAALVAVPSCAQTTVTLPGSITAIAGSTPTATTAGSACAANSPFTATDANGDGCPAVNAKFLGVETSLVSDAAGNLYISANSTNPQIVRKIDAHTGLITQFAGYATSQCASGNGTKIYGTKAAQTSKTGDNCPVSYSYGFSGPVDLGVDPYGNVLIGTTGDNVLHMVCNATSPACSSTQVAENLMITVAGCTAGATTSYGTAVSGTTPGTAGDGNSATQFTASCTSGVGGRIYGVTADKWDNIYFADATNTRYRVVAGAPSVTINGVTYTNPLYATLQTSTTAPNNYATVTQGNIYPIAGGGTVCAAKTDAYGDGCPFTQTLVNSSSSGALMQGIAVDNEGDFIFDDGEGNLRVIYEGGTVIKGALSANGIASPQLGYSYVLIGGGTAINYNSGLSGLVKGTAAALQSGAYQILTKDPAGNILIGDQEQVLFYDIATGYMRRLSTAYNATACASATDTLGDGCAFTQSSYGTGSKALSLSEDTFGNLYILDLKNSLVRKVSTNALPTTSLNGSFTSSLTVHSPVAGATLSVASPTGTDYTLGGSTCTTNADSSVDCTQSLTYAPTQLATRSAPLMLSTSANSAVTSQSLSLNATSAGTALVFDTATTPATTTLAATTTGNTTVLTDGSGNLYINGTQGISKISGGAVTSIAATPAKYMAVDTAGNVYATAGNTSTITEYAYSASTGTYTSTTLTLPQANLCTYTASSISCASAQVESGPLTVDAYGTLFVVDLTHLQAVRYSPSSGIALQLTQTAFTAPTAVTQDTYGNLLVLDGTSLLEVPAAGYPTLITSPTANAPIKLAATLTAPTSIAVDQGENIYIADSGSIKVQSASNFAQTATDYQYTLPGVAGTAVAVDGTGDLYTVQSSVAGVTKVLRNAASFSYGANYTEAFNGVFLNTGASNATGFTQTDTLGDYAVAAPATPLATGAPTCSFASTALLGGGLCNAAITFPDSGGGTGPVPDVISLLPAANTLGSVTLTGTGNSIAENSTTSLIGNTAGLIYSTGTETTFTATVTLSPAAVPTGSVAVSIDSGAAANYALTQVSSSSATATIPIVGLAAGSHTIVASFGSGASGSTSSPITFSIAQLATTTTWTPTATTQQYSAPLGNGVLNAAATTVGGGSVAGSIVYLATPSGGSPQEVHGATYLPIGTYSLSATFYPNDSVDYTTSTASVGTYTVTQATTSAPIGGTQSLVASDGTGNYTAVQPAIDALGANGGSVYIKPGTYTGDITVVQPNVALRGLGGDPTQVILTHSGGAFNNGQSQNQYAGEFNVSQNNGYQLAAGSTVFNGDEASATLVVARSINAAVSTSQLTPNNFYADYLTLQNTFNTDDVTTTSTQVFSGACTANGGSAQTYKALYNSGVECASQALAIWLAADTAVLNNVYTTSQQDTVYAASISSGSYPSRQYWFRGKITGDVDFIFGDAAAVFDHTTIYTTWHGISATGTETIEAQNAAIQNGTSSTYYSGYIMNSDIFTSQSTGMTSLYFGRPYGTYSTWIMLNSAVDQVAPVGYTTGLGPVFTYNTYGEYNDSTYTDPAYNTADANGVLYVGSGGNTGTGVLPTSARESVSTDPGYIAFSANTTNAVGLTQPQAQQFYPLAFLGRTIATNSYNTVATWNPTAAIAADANAFVPTTSPSSITYGQSITLLMRPQTPGLGAVTNGVYTIPTGTYTLYDNGSQIATGSLDASGEATYTSSTLAGGNHSFTWSYSGDTNFAGSTTTTAYTLNVIVPKTTPTVTLSGASPIIYGQTETVTVTVTGSGTTPTGTVTLSIGGTPLAAGTNVTLTNGQASIQVSGLTVGGYAFSATYSGDGNYNNAASTSNFNVAVSPYPLSLAASCANRAFYAANACTVTVPALVNGDTTTTVFAVAPAIAPNSFTNSPAGSYTPTTSYTLTTYGATNYTVSVPTNTYTVTGSGSAAQVITFAPLPNFTHGSSYQLSATSSSGLPVTYTVTSGNATITTGSSVLQVTGTGPVSITATCTDSANDYAAATPVIRSFTAQ